MGYDNYRRSSLRALHIRSKLRRLISDSTSDLDAISDNTEPTPPLTPVNGQIPRKDCFISNHEYQLHRITDFFVRIC